MRTAFEQEVTRGERFQFGRNWRSFLGVLNDERIAEAEKSLAQMLGTHAVKNKRFLDIGSGSGLFSLAARRLGARAHSFDYDPDSVACARELKRRYFPDDPDWTIEQGSVLDHDYMAFLGQFDVVYAWGVLHHTGNMALALENAGKAVARDGKLYVAIYNDQGWKSRRWRKIKRLYCSGVAGKWAVSAVFIPYFSGAGLGVDIVKGQNPLTRYSEYKRSRGMSRVHDWFDWLGGYPFEVAKPEDIIHWFIDRGFVLKRLKTCGGGLGCNEFVFQRC